MSAPHIILDCLPYLRHGVVLVVVQYDNTIHCNIIQEFNMY